MPYGNFYVGKSGFKYKKQTAGGSRYNNPIGVITGVPADVNNKYVPGAGVGASSIATRRAKLNHATLCTGNYPCNKLYSRLGLQMSGGSNSYALNWYINDTFPSPYQSPTPVSKSLHNYGPSLNFSTL